MLIKSLHKEDVLPGIFFNGSLRGGYDIMNSLMLGSDLTVKPSGHRCLSLWRHNLFHITVLAICAALVLPGPVMAKNSGGSSGKCFVGVATGGGLIYTGSPFTLRITHGYPGQWFAPMVNAKVVFSTPGGGKISLDYTETEPPFYKLLDTRTVMLIAPGKDVVDMTDAVITAEVVELINFGKKKRKTRCERATAPVMPAN